MCTQDSLGGFYRHIHHYCIIGNEGGMINIFFYYIFFYEDLIANHLVLKEGLDQQSHRDTFLSTTTTTTQLRLNHYCC